MTYVANEDFPLPICDNVRATIVNYTKRNCVSKEVFEEVINQLLAAIQDLDRRVTALEENPPVPPQPGEEDYDPENERVIVPTETVEDETVTFDEVSVIPYDVDVEGGEYNPTNQQVVLDNGSVVNETANTDMIPVDVEG